MVPMMDEYLRPQDAARLLNVTVRTLNNWEKKGKIKAIITPGGRRRYAKADIEAILTGIYQLRVDDSTEASDVKPPGRKSHTFRPATRRRRA